MKLHGASYNCCIHSEEECTMLVECARNGLIKKVNQRLSDVEKKGIRPGDIFIYTEDEAQIIRWTDKKTWTPSRVQGIFLTYKDLSGPFIKKTYTCILGSERHRIVAYALAKWEETGDCCLHFIDKIEELHRLASKIGLWVNRKNSFTKGFRSGSSIKGMPLLEQSRRDGGVLLGESRYNGGSFTYSPNGESISKIEFGKNTNSLNQRMYLDDEILQTFNDTSTIEQMKNHQNDKYISQFEACDMNKCGYTNECQIEDNYRGYCEDKRLDNGKYIGESYKASYYSDDQAEDGSKLYFQQVDETGNMLNGQYDMIERVTPERRSNRLASLFRKDLEICEKTSVENFKIYLSEILKDESEDEEMKSQVPE